jgi:hypothetical protein
MPLSLGGAALPRLPRRVLLSRRAAAPKSRSPAFARNAQAGGWPQTRLAATLTLARTLFDGPVDLEVLRG